MHLLGKVHLHRPLAQDAKYLLGVDGADDQLLTHGNVSAVFDQQSGPLGNRVGNLFPAVIWYNDELAGFVGVIDPNPTCDLTDRGHPLWGTRFEQFDHPRQTVGDVLARNPTGVEGTHRQLRSRLTN